MTNTERLAHQFYVTLCDSLETEPINEKDWLRLYREYQEELQKTAYYTANPHKRKPIGD